MVAVYHRHDDNDTYTIQLVDPAVSSEPVAERTMRRAEIVATLRCRNRPHQEEPATAGPDQVAVHRMCRVTGETGTVIMSSRGFSRWMSGEGLEVAEPALSAADRLLLERSVSHRGWVEGTQMDDPDVVATVLTGPQDYYFILEPSR